MANAKSLPQSRFKYLRTSRDTTQRDPLRTRDKGVCKWGGGAAPSPNPFFFLTPCRLVFKNPEPVIKMFANGGPPNPPRFFLRHAGCLSRKSHHQQELRQTCSCYGVFLSHKIAAAIILAAKTKPISTPSEPVIKVFAKWGGFAPLPPPQPPAFFTPCRLTSSNFAPTKTEPIWTLSEPVIKVFADGGAAPPPTPPLFLRHAGWGPRKSQELRQTRSCYGVFCMSYRQSVCK